MRSAYPSEWLASSDRAERDGREHLHPRPRVHRGGPVSKEELRAYHKALEAVIAEATRLHQAGVPVEDAIKQANFGEYASWTLAKSQGPIAIRKVYEELPAR